MAVSGMTWPARVTSWAFSSISMSANRRIPVVLGLGTDAAQDGVHPGHHLGEGERLGDVVVPADGQPGHLVLDGVAGGQEEDGDPDPVGPEPAGDLEPVEVGQHHVEHDEVGRVLLGRGQRQAAVDRLGHLEPLVAEGGGDGVDDRRLVVDDQDALAAGGLHGISSGRLGVRTRRGVSWHQPASHRCLHGRCDPAVSRL